MKIENSADKKVWHKAHECAAVIVQIYLADDRKNIPEISRNWRYFAALWGKAMRGHMNYIRANGLESRMKPHVALTVSGAEDILKAECDGQDCSFKAG
jgi:hypothetical protein